MRRSLRELFNTLFTSAAGLSVLLMAAALLFILGPMIYRGAGAVVFNGTVEFRRLQYHEPMFDRGNGDKLAVEWTAAQAARQPIYDILERFGAAVDPTPLQQKLRRQYRELRKQLRNRVENSQLSTERMRELTGKGRKIRNTITEALDSTDNDSARQLLEHVLDDPDRAAFAGTAGESMFQIAVDYLGSLKSMDLATRETYAEPLVEVRELVRELFGPREVDGPAPDLMKDRYGSTRWDMTQKILHELKWRQEWVSDGPGLPLRAVDVPRKEVFAGTEMVDLLDRIERDAEAMMRPKLTFYWQYFIDDSATSHYIGGVGPDIMGTLLLTALTMLASVPVGIVTAAFLVECTRDTLLVRAIRTCINTLAGVPSIVFGLFGLAFFVLTVQPMLGLKSQSSILAGGLTLAVLVLPIIIRASEEAIKSVPPTYKEASLSLGAGATRTFMTVTLPAAMPGVLTGIILSMSRAAGETAPILFTAAVAFRMGMPESIFEGGTRSLAYSGYDVAVGDRVAMDVPHNQYGIIMTLILLVGLLNVVAIAIRWRMAKRLRGT